MVILFVALWLAAGYIRSRMAAQQEAALVAARRAVRRRALARAADSATAQEKLGDLLCEEGEISRAIACYEHALELQSRTPVTSRRGGRIPGVGLRIKLRLAREELAAPPPTERLRRNREPFCRCCGARAWSPDDRVCPCCGEPLLAERLVDTLRERRLRCAVLRESAEASVMVVLVTITIRMGAGMPLVACCCLMLAMSLAISLRLVRNFGGGV